ncbi:MAG: hypothetical protein OXE04_04520 [bacterium]|nr:hypothetical protein [bacterium]
MSEPLKLEAQPRATEVLAGAATQPVHAYLFYGPRGTGKRAGALAFAAEIISSDERGRRLALAGQHPDLSIHSPEGRSLRVAEADDIIFEVSRSPVEANRKVVICERFHTAEPEAVAALLKTIEEPPAGAVILLLSEEIPPSHVTVASRCVVVEFDPVPDAEIRRILEAEGVPLEALDSIVAAASGDLSRARLLATDKGLAQRSQAWAAALGRLDGSGYTVTKLVEELRGLIDQAQAPLEERQTTEATQLTEIEANIGKQARQRREMDARHRREQRLLRTDELRFGMATLAEIYRRQIGANPRADQRTAKEAKEAVTAIGRIRQAHASLIRNPNEALLLQALFLALPAIQQPLN